MFTQLTKSGGKWAIEVSGGPHEGTLVKTFASRDAADKWRRDVGSGKEAAPVLKPKRAAAGKDKAVAPKKEKAASKASTKAKSKAKAASKEKASRPFSFPER